MLGDSAACVYGGIANNDVIYYTGNCFEHVRELQLQGDKAEF